MCPIIDRPYNHPSHTKIGGCVCVRVCVFLYVHRQFYYMEISFRQTCFFHIHFFFITLQPIKRCISFFSLFNIEYKFKFQIQIYQYKNANLIRIIKCFHCHQFYASQFLNYTRYVSFSLSFFFFCHSK